MQDILIERMRAAICKLDDRAIAARGYNDVYYLEVSDLRDLLEQAIKRIEDYMWGLRP